MSDKTVNTNITRVVLRASVTALFLLVVLSTPGFGQEEQTERVTSRDGLTAARFMTGPKISDDLEGNDDEYFYKFKAGPGKLTVTLEVAANETNAGAMLDLFSGAKPVLSNMLVQAANRGSEIAFQSVNLSKEQDIIIRIKGMRYGSSARYPGTYKLLLDGPAVKFDELPVEGQGGQEVPIPPATEGKTPQNNLPDAPLSENAGLGNKPAEVPAPGTNPTKKPDAVDKAVEKGKSKTNKVLEILNKIKTKIPD